MKYGKFAAPALAILVTALLSTSSGAEQQSAASMSPAANTAPKATPSSGRRPEYKIESGTSQLVESPGLPRETLPGAKFITTDEWFKMREIPKSGLYIVDRENVPNGLAEELKAEGYRLSRDGTLTDSKGKQRAAFVGGRMYSSGGTAQKGGWLYDNLRKYAQGAADALVTPAKAGNPYRFACWSTHYMAVYESGFCNSQTLTVWDDAWGPNSKNTCSGSLPHTNITNLQVRANISNANNGGSEHICKNANHCSTTTEWDIGCWWPAYGSTELTAFWSGIDKDPAHNNPSHQASESWFH